MKAYGYARVSHKDSIDADNSIPTQKSKIYDFFRTHLQLKGVEWAGVEDDGGHVSAFRVKFHNRPAGKRLLEKLRPGDHLIVDRVDRFWRSLEDFINLMKLLKSRDITVHIVDFQGATVTSNTTMGDFILKIIVMLAELESTIKSERTKEALAYARKRGKCVYAVAPPGTKIVSKVDPDGIEHKFLRWSEKKRAIMRHIVYLRDDKRLKWEDCYEEIEEFAASIEGRAIRPVEQQKIDRLKKWRKLYKYETAYRYLGIREPGQIPKVHAIDEAARQYRRLRSESRMSNRKPSEIGVLSPEDILDNA